MSLFQEERFATIYPVKSPLTIYAFDVTSVCAQSVTRE